METNQGQATEGITADVGMYAFATQPHPSAGPALSDLYFSVTTDYRPKPFGQAIAEAYEVIHPDYDRTKLECEKMVLVGPGKLGRGAVAPLFEQAIGNAVRGMEGTVRPEDALKHGIHAITLKGDDWVDSRKTPPTGNSGLRSSTAARLNEQEGVYTTLEKHDRKEVCRVIQCIGKATDASVDRSLAVGPMIGAGLVMLSVGASAYCLDGNHKLDLNNPFVRADRELNAPAETLIGMLASALYTRWKDGREDWREPFALMIFENMPGAKNGEVVKEALRSFAVNSPYVKEPEFLAYIDKLEAFSTVIDRICASPESDEVSKIENMLGVDRLTVSVERRERVVVEISEQRARKLGVPWLLDPQLRGEGTVVLTGDIEPYVAVKTAFVNAPHAAAAIASAGLGLEGATTARLMAAAGMRQFIGDLVQYELAPAVAAEVKAVGIKVPGAVRETVVRFACPRMRDPLSRICNPGNVESKMRDRILPYIADNFAAGREAPCLMLISAIFVTSERWGQAAEEQKKAKLAELLSEVVKKSAYCRELTGILKRFNDELDDWVDQIRRVGTANLLANRWQ